MNFKVQKLILFAVLEPREHHNRNQFEILRFLVPFRFENNEFLKIHVHNFEVLKLILVEVLEPRDHQNRNQREILRFLVPLRSENNDF